ncbi:phosphatase PAP2 family protein [Albibacterium bauzanense]|uniref:PAP2 superfamily protein n=1 Tax=Albibacterium bauzanense TaxID=653929 RepID=A0A4R1LW45_9SPHI|nr:phosphatase PAP2 family protein [Albibacterium bauzanense]TCK83648.1 PAP2 superfamily protein [Albibacterium bauzanense]
MAIYLKFLKQILYHTRWFLFPLAFFLTAGTFFLLLHRNSKAFLLLNGLNIALLDRPAMWLTELSSSLILTAVFVLIGARKYPKETLLALATAFTAWYISIAIKYNFFQSWHSPSMVFKPIQAHVLAPVLQPELNLPSSHAAVISALFFAVAALFSLKRSLLVSMALLSIIFMYTRIYVGWSYLADILAGSLIGIISFLLFFDMFRHLIYKWYYKRTEWAQGLVIASLRTAAICTIFVNLKHAIL